MISTSHARRTSRPSGDARQRAIVDALEQLLQSRALGDIAIDEIAARSSLSRSAFYFYFPSKQAVLLELLDAMVHEVDERLATHGPPPEEDLTAWWAAVIGVFVDVFTNHRAVTITLNEARATIPEVRAEWSRRSARWIDRAASVIQSELRAGRARSQLDPVATSIALNAMNERVLVTTLSDETPSIAPEQVLATLVDIWCTTIYGSPRP